MIALIIFLITISANGLTIPALAWVLLGIDITLKIILMIIKIASDAN